MANKESSSVGTLHSKVLLVPKLIAMQSSNAATSVSKVLLVSKYNLTEIEL
jgi:hypothetical protein